MRVLWVPMMAVLAIIILMGCEKSSTGLVAADNFGNGTANITLNITQPQDESVVRSNPVTVSGSVNSAIEVMVNGISANLENSRFLVMVELEAGPNMIEILARDSSGKETAKYVNIVYVP